MAGALTPVLAPQRSMPMVLGPLAGLIASGAVQVLASSYPDDGQPTSEYLTAARHLPAVGVLLLVAGAATAGLGVVRHLAEQIHQDPAEAERDRLARPIRDGVLPVLARVRRDGADPRLAELAAEQDAALRKLLRGDGTHGH